MKKKEVPFEVAGQMSLLEDFPEVVPDADPEQAMMVANTEPEVDPDAIEYDREILEGMIQKAKEALDIMRDRWIRDQPRTYTKHSMELQAYEMLLQAHTCRGEG